MAQLRPLLRHPTHPHQPPTRCRHPRCLAQPRLQPRVAQALAYRHRRDRCRPHHLDLSHRHRRLHCRHGMYRRRHRHRPFLLMRHPVDFIYHVVWHRYRRGVQPANHSTCCDAQEVETSLAVSTRAQGNGSNRPGVHRIVVFIVGLCILAKLKTAMPFVIYLLPCYYCAGAETL